MMWNLKSLSCITSCKQLFNLVVRQAGNTRPSCCCSTVRSLLLHITKYPGNPTLVAATGV